MPEWLAVVGFGHAMEQGPCGTGCIFWGILAFGGGVTPGQIAMGRPHWINFSGQNNQAYHNQSSGGFLGAILAVGRIGQGKEKQLNFVVCIFWNFCWQGDFKAHLNCNRMVKFHHSAWSPTSKTPQSTSVWQGVGLCGKGKVLQLHFQG